MTRDLWHARNAQNALRNQERRQLEAGFNAEILRRHHAGEHKDDIVAALRISRELFNRVVRTAKPR